jgi:hypothetical protein
MCQGLRCENLHLAVKLAVIFISSFGLMMDKHQAKLRFFTPTDALSHTTKY